MLFDLLLKFDKELLDVPLGEVYHPLMVFLDQFNKNKDQKISKQVLSLLKFQKNVLINY
jgi:hypothetical protein